MSDAVIDKENKDDIWRDHNKNDFIFITYFAKHRILKHNFINIIKFVYKEKLIVLNIDRIVNNLNNDFLSIVQRLLNDILIVRLIIILFS